MKPGSEMVAISALKWTTGVVVLSEALHLAISATSARHFADFGLARWVRPALAWSEVASALLFLAPLTTVVGGYLLLTIFFLAIAVHIHGDDFRIGTLLVYAMVVFVAISHQKKKVGGSDGD